MPDSFDPMRLPEAPANVTRDAIEVRRLVEVHPCARCGAEAWCAYAAETPVGLRWLDLCLRCDAELWRFLRQKMGEHVESLGELAEVSRRAAEAFGPLSEQARRAAVAFGNALADRHLTGDLG